MSDLERSSGPDFNPLELFSLAAQEQTAINTALHMRDTYHQHMNYANDPDTHSGIVEFSRELSLTTFDGYLTINQAATDSYVRESGIYSEHAAESLSACARAYRALITREDKEWLLDFLESTPAFTDDVGGIPDWLSTV